jgi:hypothetical protein
MTRQGVVERIIAVSLGFSSLPMWELRPKTIFAAKAYARMMNGKAQLRAVLAI